MQLSVTPREEGILKIIGVKWKLSGSVIGFYNLTTSPTKKIASRKRNNKPSIDNLKFVVIKVCLTSLVIHRSYRPHNGSPMHVSCMLIFVL